VSTVTTTGTSRISPLNERVYHQSNLLGDWKGSSSKTHRPIEVKVVSITGNTAQVEYTHNGRTERVRATVDKNTITFNNVTIATRNGKKAALEFSFGPARDTAILNKTAAPVANQNKLVGSWTGGSSSHGASFQVVSINGRDAQVRYNIDGKSKQGVGDVTSNAVFFGKVQFSSTDGLNGTLVFPSGHDTVSLPVKKFTPKIA
jgi:hypothetical protein